MEIHMPYKLKDPYRHKFKRPNYNKRDWKAYEAGLRSRGSLTFWICEDAIAQWSPCDALKKRGRPAKYSDFAIEISHTLRLVYHLGLRQTEGFLQSIFQLMNIDLFVPDHTTLSRRGETVALSKRNNPLPRSGTIIIDSTGLKVTGEKEWMNYKHGTKQRKVWRKLHLCIDDDGNICGSTLTTHTISDTSQVAKILEDIDHPIDTFFGDGGYDFPSAYKAFRDHNEGHDIQMVVPPNTGFQEAQESDDPQRLENIKEFENKGRLAWQNKNDYGKRSQVENTMHRYKAIIGNKIRARTTKGQIKETQIAVQILNRMNDLGKSNAARSI